VESGGGAGLIFEIMFGELMDMAMVMVSQCLLLPPYI
jgi:hypothetical protein